MKIDFRLPAICVVITLLWGCLSGGGGGGSDVGSSAPPGAGVPGAGVPGTSSFQIVGTNRYDWRFTCAGGPCLTGTFIDGDPWIAPKQPGEQILLTSVTTTGTDAGMEVNPINPNLQGFLSCSILAPTYSPALNKAILPFPLTVNVDSSVVKASSKTTGCAPASAGCCIDTYGVLTVLAVPPVNNGLEAFRPGTAGNTKKIYYLSDFDFTKIPSNADVSASGYAANFADTHTRWHTHVVDHYMWTLGDNGRALIPSGVPDYGAAQGQLYLGDLIRVMGTEPLSAKMPAITGLLQRGIDLYASYKSGITWPSGAGQQVGRKPPIAFFAALLNDNTIKAEVSALPANNANLFHEDGQIQINTATGNIPVWGDQCDEGVYWSNVFYAQQFDGGTGVQIGSGDNTRTCGDPYRRIDGPGGIPGTFYMDCCSTGPFIGYQVAQSVMPALCTAANDPELSTYTRRILNSGIHTQPDVCAPPDPAENPACAPYAVGTPNCNFYQSTWGPNPLIPGDCIRNGPGQSGRHPARHGIFFTNDGTINGTSTIFYEPPIARTLRTNLGVGMLNACN